MEKNNNPSDIMTDALRKIGDAFLSGKFDSPIPSSISPEFDSGIPSTSRPDDPRKRESSKEKNYAVRFSYL